MTLLSKMACASVAVWIAAYGVAADGWRIEAGAIEVTPGAPARVSGTFHVHAPAGTPPEAAPRAGGACLVADLVPFGVGAAACQSNADCNTPEAIDTQRHPGLDGAYGYCAAPDGSGESSRCWTRPGTARTYCSRSIDGLRLTPGTHRIAAVPADPLDFGGPLPNWAVVACLADAAHPAACGEQSGEHRQFSMTRQVRGEKE